jgi:hypothetical protein
MDVHQKDSVMNKSVLDIDAIGKHGEDMNYDDDDFEEINIQQEIDMDDEFDNSPIQHIQEPTKVIKKMPPVLPMKNLNLISP